MESPAVLPRSFGRYQLFDRIGRGGMADIFLARASTELGAERLVVVKQILAPLSRDATFARMFVEEAKLCAGLRHANVVQVLDLGREDGLLYMAMEYVEGFDLHQLLTRCSKARIALPAEFAIFIVSEVLAALSYAHRAADASGASLGIVHRDVSPSNVLMSFEGEVKLCDFGIARAAGRAAMTGERSDAPRVVGKSAYMSPEHARGDEIDARADVFAAGILLWELCAGRRLYRGTEAEMLELARAAEIPPLPERGLPAPAALQAILDRALTRDRDARFATAADMRAALDGYALTSRLFASQIRFGSFLTDHFGEQFIGERRARERGARALEMGPPVRIEALPPLAAQLPLEAQLPLQAPLQAQKAARAIADEDTGRLRVREPDTDPQQPTFAPLPAPAPRAPAPARRGAGTWIAIAVLIVIAIVAIAFAFAR